MTKREALKQAIYANKKDRRIKLIRQAWEDFDKPVWVMFTSYKIYAQIYC